MILQNAKVEPGEIENKVLKFSTDPKAFTNYCISYLKILLESARNPHALAQKEAQINWLMGQLDQMHGLYEAYRKSSGEHQANFKIAVSCMCAEDTRRLANALAISQAVDL